MSFAQDFENALALARSEAAHPGCQDCRVKALTAENEMSLTLKTLDRLGPLEPLVDAILTAENKDTTFPELAAAYSVMKRAIDAVAHVLNEKRKAAGQRVIDGS